METKTTGFDKARFDAVAAQVAADSDEGDKFAHMKERWELGDDAPCKCGQWYGELLEGVEAEWATARAQGAPFSFRGTITATMERVGLQRMFKDGPILIAEDGRTGHWVWAHLYQDGQYLELQSTGRCTSEGRSFYALVKDMGTVTAIADAADARQNQPCLPYASTFPGDDGAPPEYTDKFNEDFAATTAVITGIGQRSGIMDANHLDRCDSCRETHETIKRYAFKLHKEEPDVPVVLLALRAWTAIKRHEEAENHG